MTTFFEDDEKSGPTAIPQAGLRVALSVAGLDPSGGAGILADVRTFDAMGVFGMAAVATVTYQSTLGVKGRFDLPASAVRAQLEEIFADRNPNAVKTGALGTAEAVREVGLFLAEGFLGPVVVDPVIVASSGGTLLNEEGIAAIVDHLMPGAAMVTPNVREVEALIGFEVFDLEDVKAAALRLVAMGARSALITGVKVDHDSGPVAADVFCDGEAIDVLSSPWVEGLEVHGTGCVLSAAITAGLAKGMTLKDAVSGARALTSSGVEGAVQTGRGQACANPWALSQAEAAAPLVAGAAPNE